MGIIIQNKFQQKLMNLLNHLKKRALSDESIFFNDDIVSNS